MLDWLWQTIIYNIPWWVWAWIALLILGVFFMWARSVGGVKNALVIVGAVALAVAAGLISVKGRQQGAQDRQEKEQRDANATLDKAHQARADARANSSPDRLRDDDGFRRDD